MSGIREQADGIADKACHCLDDDEKQVEGYGHYIDCGKLLDGVTVLVVMVMMVHGQIRCWLKRELNGELSNGKKIR